MKHGQNDTGKQLTKTKSTIQKPENNSFIFKLVMVIERVQVQLV